MYDAVVVGAGPNGLTAAITLAEAGRSVLVLEQAAVIGGGARSAELTLPGFIHDICSTVHPLGITSPAFRRMPLAAHGLDWIQPPAAVAHPLDWRRGGDPGTLGAGDRRAPRAGWRGVSGVVRVARGAVGDAGPGNPRPDHPPAAPPVPAGAVRPACAPPGQHPRAESFPRRRGAGALRRDRRARHHAARSVAVRRVRLRAGPRRARGRLAAGARRLAAVGDVPSRRTCGRSAARS